MMMPAPIKRPLWSASLLVAAALLSACGDDTPGAQPQEVRALPVALAPDAPGYSGDNAYVHCAAICALGPRPSGSEAYHRQVEYLRTRLGEVNWQVRCREFSPRAGCSMVNVHATFGDGEGVRPLLISCHIDTKGRGADSILGADDGASGAAALLELARVLARHPRLAAQVELVFFDGEEAFGPHITEMDGLVGSYYEVMRRREAEEPLPRRMINLDMVGGAGKVIGVPVADTSVDMYAAYEKAIRTLGLSEDRWTLYPGSYLDDHLPFAEAGVETLNLIAMFQGSDWWHTQRDDMSRISPESLGETGRVVMQLIEQLLSE